LRPRTLYDYGRFVDVAFKDWKDRPLVERTKEQVAKLHQKLTAERGPAYADGAMRFLRALINFAQFHYEAPDGSPLLPDNPVRRLSQTRAWNGSKRRKTYIKPDQLAAWFKAVLSLKADPDDHEALTVSDWLQLMMLTGFRRNEALTLQWQYVDMPNRTLTVRDTKNGEDHTLPMSDYVHDLLEERRKLTGDKDYVFASYGKHGHMVDPRKPLDHVIKACGIPFTPHDLRRTFITVAESLDVPMYALKRLLNHKMSGDITPTYIITDVERLRIPMEKVTQHILERAGLSPATRKRKERAA
jgi:integrase